MTGSLLSYEEDRIEARYTLAKNIPLNGPIISNANLKTILGGVVRSTDTDIMASGNIPNFGFGPDFGFRYGTDIDIVEYGATAGVQFDFLFPTVSELPQTEREWVLHLGATADLLHQDVDARDTTFLGGGAAGTLLDDAAGLERDGTAINYRVYGGISATPRSGAYTFSAGAFFERAEDSFYVERSGAVGGMARLKRDDSETYGATFKVTFPLGGPVNGQ